MSQNLGKYENEEIKARYREHPIILLFKLLGLFQILLIWGFWYFFATALLPAETLKTSTIWLINGTFLLAAISAVFSAIIHHRVGQIIITEKRIIWTRFNGVFDYRIEEMLLNQIESAKIKQEGLLQNIFNFGHIILGNDLSFGGAFKIQNIGNPRKVLVKLDEITIAPLQKS